MRCEDAANAGESRYGQVQHATSNTDKHSCIFLLPFRSLHRPRRRRSSHRWTTTLNPPNVPPFDAPDVRKALDALRVAFPPVGRNFPLRKPLDRVAPGAKTPRARNPWILYRSDVLQAMNEDAGVQGTKGGKRLKPQAGLSRDIAADWHNETTDVREYYQYISEIEKIEHKAIYPDYKFAPRTKEEKEAERAEEKRITDAAKAIARAKKLEERRDRQAQSRSRKQTGTSTSVHIKTDDADASELLQTPYAGPSHLPTQIKPPTTLQSRTSHHIFYSHYYHSRICHRPH